MPKRVILIEDDPVTVKVTGDALARVAPEVRLEVMRDGLGAVERLFRHSDNTRDEIVLVILDLHIPRLHGMDLLRELKSAARDRFLPVVVISGTATPDQTGSFIFWAQTVTSSSLLIRLSIGATLNVYGVLAVCECSACSSKDVFAISIEIPIRIGMKEQRVVDPGRTPCFRLSPRTAGFCWALA